MQRRNLAIFDFDGTIADSLGWFFNAMNEAARLHRFREISVREREELRGRSNREILAYLGLPDWKLPLVAQTLRSLAARDIDQIHTFPWVPELFRDLSSRGTIIAIVSSNAEENIRQVLGAEVASRVTHVAAGASLLGKARRFKAVIRKCGLLGGRMAAIGDEVRDIEAAQKAGIASLAVTWGAAPVAHLEAALPTRLIAHPSEIGEWFSA